MKHRFGILVAIAVFTAGAAAAPYPSHPVRLMCWSSAGSPLDVMMRQLGKQLGDVTGATFVVENRPGGEGAVAMSAVTSQPANGYMILSTTSSMSFAMAMGDIRYKPDDFIVLPALQAEPSAVAVRRDSRFKTMTQFVDFIRGHPDKLSVGGFSSAGFHQYVFYRLQQVGHFSSIWVPFRGGQDAALALMGGHIDVAIMTPSSALAQIKHGDIRLLGIGSEKRNENFPDVPTFKEEGYDVAASIWRGIMVKAGTPQAVIDTLLAAIARIERTDEWQRFSQQNMQNSVDISLRDMQEKVRAEVAQAREFLISTGLKK
ncbi:MAG: tripartite tricarboxylate transporter substrate binding protein [Bradyrhizobiaceae bacterium]|nr:tripartite tricarboxylate transporter substrate binding protein [Bradyrhizobiaceae bacterium]